jgi:hypothetical protein
MEPEQRRDERGRALTATVQTCRVGSENVLTDTSSWREKRRRLGVHKITSTAIFAACDAVPFDLIVTSTGGLETGQWATTAPGARDRNRHSGRCGKCA